MKFKFSTSEEPVAGTDNGAAKNGSVPTFRYFGNDVRTLSPEDPEVLETAKGEAKDKTMAISSVEYTIKDMEEIDLRHSFSANTLILREDSAGSIMNLGIDIVDDNDGEVCLMYARHEKIPMKDFAAEIRASMDVENFLNQAVLLLDLAENSVEAIIDHMLRRILEKNEPQVQVEDAVKACFTHDTVHKLAKTIQGTCITYGGGFDFDQSWICILCTMPSLQKRHVAIARLRTPANLGRTSQEVYFIILVAAPKKKKVPTATLR